MFDFTSTTIGNGLIQYSVTKYPDRIRKQWALTVDDGHVICAAAYFRSEKHAKQFADTFGLVLTNHTTHDSPVRETTYRGWSPGSAMRAIEGRPDRDRLALLEARKLVEDEPEVYDLKEYPDGTWVLVGLEAGYPVDWSRGLGP